MLSLRQQILTAARHRFLKEGLSAISMRRIAADIGVSATAIYRHYQGKEDLLDDLAEEGFALFEIYLRRGANHVENGNDAAESSNGYIQRVLRLTEDYLSFALEHERYFGLMFLESRKNLRRFPRDFEQKKSQSFLILQDLVSTCIRFEAFRKDDPMQVTLTLWAHIHGLVSLYMLGRFGTETSRFRAIYNQSVQRLLRGLQT